MTIRISIEKSINSCFVIMPFSTLFQTEYEKIIQPCLEELNIQCVRGDEIFEKQRITDDIWKSIRECRFVLAELSGKNPNVLYELGLAHTIGKPVIVITRNGDDVPFFSAMTPPRVIAVSHFKPVTKYFSSPTGLR